MATKDTQIIQCPGEQRSEARERRGRPQNGGKGLGAAGVSTETSEDSGLYLGFPLPRGQRLCAEPAVCPPADTARLTFTSPL